jgi:hypothetical protein
MTNGRWFNIKFTQFVELIRLSAHLDTPKSFMSGE